MTYDSQWSSPIFPYSYVDRKNVVESIQKLYGFDIDPIIPSQNFDADGHHDNLAGIWVKSKPYFFSNKNVFCFIQNLQQLTLLFFIFPS